MNIKNLISGIQRFMMSLKRPSKKENLRKLSESGETPGSFTFRDATENDVAELGKLHAITWAQTYNSKNVNIQLRQQQWKKEFNEKNDGSWFCLVVVNNKNELVGFAKGKINKDENSSGLNGDLNKIYLLSNYQRLGLGKKLFRLAVERFLNKGVKEMYLFGIPQNPSCSFHEAMGGKRIYNNKGVFDGGYHWPDINKI